MWVVYSKLFAYVFLLFLQICSLFVYNDKLHISFSLCSDSFSLLETELYDLLPRRRVSCVLTASCSNEAVCLSLCLLCS